MTFYNYNNFEENLLRELEEDIYDFEFSVHSTRVNKDEFASIFMFEHEIEVSLCYDYIWTEEITQKIKYIDKSKICGVIINRDKNNDKYSVIFLNKDGFEINGNDYTFKTNVDEPIPKMIILEPCNNPITPSKDYLQKIYLNNIHNDGIYLITKKEFEKLYNNQSYKEFLTFLYDKEEKEYLDNQKEE